MLDRILPSLAGNDYRGHRLGLWLFWPITLLTIVRSCIHVFRVDGGAQSIATIPLDTFTQGGGAAVVTVFALWGLSQLLLGLVYLVVLLRYRALIPLMYLLLLLEYLGRAAIGAMKPILTMETPPGARFGTVMIVLSFAGLVLSLRSKDKPHAPAA
ncbi:MAG: hypothetical protein ABGY42_11430 [bacterium]